MRKLVLLLLALIAVPAMAADPNIILSASGTTVTVGYTADAADLVSGMGITVTLSDGTIANFTDLQTSAGDYNIHPATIVIVDGNITDYNTPIYSGGNGDSNVVVEYGHLYDRDDANLAPAASGNLFSFDISGASGDVTVTATANHAGGIVTESLVAYDISRQLLITTDCFPSCRADYSEWVSVGKPDSWCYLRQCHGDADNAQEGNPKSGYFYVWSADLNTLLSGWKKAYSGNPTVDTWIAADFDHAQEGNPKSGYFRVWSGDLNVLTTNWKTNPAPDCLDCP